MDQPPPPALDTTPAPSRAQGHILGISDDVWGARGCSYACRPFHPEYTVMYLCKAARREFRASPSCSGELMIESEAGWGSACSHWCAGRGWRGGGGLGARVCSAAMVLFGRAAEQAVPAPRGRKPAQLPM
jgi:hypothetical protein